MVWGHPQIPAGDLQSLGAAPRKHQRLSIRGLCGARTHAVGGDAHLHARRHVDRPETERGDRPALNGVATKYVDPSRVRAMIRVPVYSISCSAQHVPLASARMTSGSPPVSRTRDTLPGIALTSHPAELQVNPGSSPNRQQAARLSRRRPKHSVTLQCAKSPRTSQPVQAATRSRLRCPECRAARPHRASRERSA